MTIELTGAIEPDELTPKPDRISSISIGAGDPSNAVWASRMSSGSGRNPGRRWPALLIAASAYLALSAFIWSNVWSHPTSDTICGCGDTSLFTWFIEWPAYAISHGLSPFYTTAVRFPGGVNIPANTSVLAIGVVLAPVTWLFGPVATMNVALTLAPALSALAMFVLLQRWVSWAPASFAGGLFYGFSPYILVSLADAHLMLGMARPPLIVACLDELLFRQQHRPVATGVVLGLLVAVQFFVGSEVLLIMAITGRHRHLAVVVLWSGRRTRALRDHARHAMVGLSAAAVTAIVLLAYPVWFALAGPAHFSGPVWPATGGSNGVATSGTSLKHFVLSAPSDNVASHLDHIIGGYQGPILSDQYFGIGVVVVLIGGCIVWRRDRRLWLFGTITLISVVLSLGVVNGLWLPWRLLANLPLVEDIYPYRIVFIVYLAVAVMLALIIDHAYQAVNRRRQRAAPNRVPEYVGGPLTHLPRWGGAAVGVILGAIAVVPPAVYLAQSVPITTRAVNLPDWFRTIAPHLSAGQVLLVIPARSGTSGSNDTPMTWQAVDGMNYSIVGVGGPSGVPQRAGKERDGAAVIARVSAFTPTPTVIAPGDIAAVRQALAGWGVTKVVIPDQTDLPTYDQVTSVTVAAELITAATGERPDHQENAWVWDVAGTASHRAIPTGARLTDCSNGLAGRGTAAVDEVVDCLSAGSRTMTCRALTMPRRAATAS